MLTKFETVDKNTPVYNRRFLFIDDGNRNFKIEWVNLLKSYFNPLILLEKPLYQTMKFSNFEYAYDVFKFPPQHPERGLVYACCDYEPDFYIPLSEFHSEAIKLKWNAFIKMCGHLGAKEIVLIHENKSESGRKNNFEGKDIPSKFGPIDGALESEQKQSQSSSARICYTYPKPNSFKLSPFENKWIESDPSWQTLQDERIKNRVSSFRVAFNYSSEMGVTENVSIKLMKAGFKIGGEFKAMKEIKEEYQVIFWDE